MTLQIIQVLLFCAIPVGILLLFFGIRSLRRDITQAPLLDLPFLNITGEFKVSKTGYYAIWQKGTLLKKAPLDRFCPHIIKTETQVKIQLRKVLIVTLVNSFDTGRTKLFYFYAEQGDYKLVLLPGNSASKFQKVLSSALPAQKIDLEHYFIQVRKSHLLASLLNILKIVIGFSMIISGLILGLLAKEMFA